ncbi:rhamnulose-1-phosphate aldolase [Breznakiellaceae bacterium SP9]
MIITELPFMKGFIRLTLDAFYKGWHERNGGNLSYRLSQTDAAHAAPFFRVQADWKPIGLAAPDLGGDFFLVTGTGRFMRNVTLNPSTAIGIIELDEKGETYCVRWGLENGGRPTSELPTHLLNHEVKKRCTKGAHRVMYHAHPANIIAVSFVLPLTDKCFTRTLWEMMPECPMVFPEGIGVLPWMVPGGRDIALASGKLIEKYNVIVWAQHGVFCSGIDFDAAFGLMEIVEKAAEIFVKISSLGGKKHSRSSKDFRDLSASLKLNLPEEFLAD